MPRTRPKRPAGGIKAPYPGFIEPALATSIDRVPLGARWVHEIKFDSYRVQVHLREGAAKVFTRRGNDWTNRFRKIAADAWHINAGSAIIDGEVVAVDESGRPSFNILQNYVSSKAPILYYVFDVLVLAGRDVRGMPLSARRDMLEAAHPIQGG